jgi:hypothetical protein
MVIDNLNCNAANNRSLHCGDQLIRSQSHAAGDEIVLTPLNMFCD